MTPARFRWGMLFILAGVLMLLANLELIRWSFLAGLVWFLPFFLIAVGLEKIFAATRLRLLSYLTTVVFVVGVLLVAVGGGHITGADFFEERVFKLEEEPGIERLNVLVEANSQDIEIRRSTRSLVRARFARFTTKPRITHRFRGSEGTVEIRAGRRSWWSRVVHADREDGRRWKLAFTRRLPLSLECRADSAELSFNLSTMPVERLNIEADDAYVYLKVGTMRPRLQVRVRGDDSILKLRLPREAEIRLQGMDDSDFLARAGFEPSDGTYIHQPADSAVSRIEVDLDDRFRSLSIDFY